MQRIRWSRGLVGLAVVGLILTGCARAGTTPAPTTAASTGSGSSVAPASVDPGASPSAVAAATCEGAGDKGDVKMMVNEWVGAAANVAVAQCLPYGSAVTFLPLRGLVRDLLGADKDIDLRA